LIYQKYEIHFRVEAEDKFVERKMKEIDLNLLYMCLYFITILIIEV